MLRKSSSWIEEKNKSCLLRMKITPLKSNFITYNIWCKDNLYERFLFHVKNNCNTSLVRLISILNYLEG